MPEHDAPDQRAEELAGLAQHFAVTAYPRLRSIARRAGVGEQLVDDVVQQGLYAFLRSYPGDSGDRRGAYSYLARAVQTSALHALRGQRRHDRRVAAAMAAAGGDGCAEPLDAALAADEVRRARALLADLPEELRLVAFLGAVGYAPSEIADLMGVSKRRVRKLVTRANTRLRELAGE